MNDGGTWSENKAFWVAILIVAIEFITIYSILEYFKG